jgi:tRNA-2-methylthio-N6-dimethylallyladenosine synthase
MTSDLCPPKAHCSVLRTTRTGHLRPFQPPVHGVSCGPYIAVPSVYIKTYGCQMNERDSEAVAAQLLAKGYTLAPSEVMADVVLLNTCSVRDMAERKALGKMRSLIADARRSRLGCMAQSRGQGLIEQLPDVDLVLGTQKFHRTADYLEDLLSGRQHSVVDVEAEPGSEAAIREHLLNGNSTHRAVTAFVSIMQGCNQRCTFCIVPHTRGLERSRPIPDIVAECEELARHGVKEVTLLGQIVTSYGRREIPARDGKSAFVQLLEAVQAVEGLERIRFTAPHPKGYGDDLVEAYARLPKLVESAHLPVQSGSDRILKAMHRGYTGKHYLDLVRKLRQVQPEIGLTTDLIVGFPDETEEDFQATLSLVREVAFDQAFLFKYSPRRDTPAAGMPNQIPLLLRKERHQQLLHLMNDIGGRQHQALVGRRVQILVEGPSRKNPARLTGRTRCNKIVVFEGSDRHRAQIMDLTITRAGAFTLYGEPVIPGIKDNSA